MLGQLQPAAGVLEDLYEVPAGKRALISSVRIASVESAAAVGEVLVTVADDGAVHDEAQTQLFLDLGLKNAFSLTEGWTLDAGDVIRVRSSTGDVAFTAYGEEYPVP